MSPSSAVDLTGHVALVTGGNHGIGAATARALAATGAGVLVTYLRIDQRQEDESPSLYEQQRAQGADGVIRGIIEAGGTALAIEADLSDASTVPMLFDRAENELGPVDILVNNASGWLADTFTSGSADRLGRSTQRVSAGSFDRQFAVDARASALLISEFAVRHARNDLDWGRIVGLTSGGSLGFRDEVSYGAAKAAMENYTMSAAVELADRGITANVVHPPVTDTGWVTDAVRQMVDESETLIHVATPEEVATVIVALLSDETGLITGNVIYLR